MSNRGADKRAIKVFPAYLIYLRIAPVGGKELARLDPNHVSNAISDVAARRSRRDRPLHNTAPRRRARSFAGRGTIRCGAGGAVASASVRGTAGSAGNLLRRRLQRRNLRQASWTMRRRVQRDRLVSLADFRAVRAAFVSRRVSRLVDQVVPLARPGHYQPDRDGSNPGRRNRPAGHRNLVRRGRRRSGRSLGRATDARLLVQPLPRLGHGHQLHVPRQQGRDV